MTRTFLTASALLLVASSVFAAPPAAKTKPAKAKTVKTKPMKMTKTTVKPAAPVKKAEAPAAAEFPTKCVVTGEAIASAKDAAGGSSVYNGKTYYFCCAGCKPQFDKDPAKFVKTAQNK